MIKSIIFDIYGTLIDIETDESKNSIVWKELLVPYMKKKEMPSYRELRKFYLKHCKIEIAKIDNDHPDIELRNVFRAIIREYLQNKYDNDEFVELIGKRFRELSTVTLSLREGCRELLSQLKDDGFLLGIISNTQDVFTWNEMERFNLTSFFDGIIFSSIYNISKPHERLFSESLKLLNIEADEAIYVGNDLKDDISGGNNAGLKTVFLGDPQRFETDIRPSAYIKNGKLTKLYTLLKKMCSNY